MMLSAFVMSVFAQQNDKAQLPGWFINPSAHTYVGISEPNGNVQDAVNAALLHYLISQNFTGKMRSNMSGISTSGEKKESQYNSITNIKIDTTLQYSIEEIVSTAKDEYICRISDKPTLSRRVVLAISSSMQYESKGDSERLYSMEEYELFFKDNSGIIAKNIIVKQSSINGIKSYKYESMYEQGNGLVKNYVNSKSESLNEQLMQEYLQLLINGFSYKTHNNDLEDKSMLLDAYHTATPISGFDYNSGHLFIQR